MKIIADEIKMPAVPADLVSNEEILLFLQKKVVEKYPQGGVKARRRIVNTGLSLRLAGEMDFQSLFVRTTSSLPAKLGYTSVYCDVDISRSEGQMEIEIKADPSFVEDSLKHLISYFNVEKRNTLVAEVEDWLSRFLESKQNPSLSSLQASPPQDNTQESKPGAHSRRCSGCGADIPSQEPVCPYCGASMPGDAVPSAVPAASAAATAVPQPVGQGPAKVQQTYLLLGILLGGLGIHNFYAGYTVKGIAQLLISVLSGGSLAVVSWIWAIIEACTVKQDARGIPFA